LLNAQALNFGDKGLNLGAAALYTAGCLPLTLFGVTDSPFCVPNGAMAWTIPN